jgi:hypothetical protein
MTREVQVIAWCDGCVAELGDGEGDVERGTVALHLAVRVGDSPGALSKPRLLDLCERHAKSLWEPLAALLDAYGSLAGDNRPRTPRRALARTPGDDVPRPWICLCGASYAGDSALRSHMANRHQMGATVRGVFGDECPLCEATSSRLGIHISKAHAETHNVTSAFVEAERLGDPRGVVARQRAALLGGN